MTDRYTITQPGHQHTEEFTGTWQELQEYILSHYTQDTLCCVMNVANTSVGYCWEDIIQEQIAV